MSGANIFIVYSDSGGQNITLSPRLGAGNFEPDYNSAAQVSLLEGSGITNGVMTANIRCMCLALLKHLPKMVLLMYPIRW